MFSSNIISTLLTKFSLVMEYSKTEVFYFSRSQGNLLWILLHLEALSSILIISSVISASFLIENYHSDITLTFIPTKQFLPSNA